MDHLVDVVEHGDAAQHHGHRAGEEAAGGVQHQLRNLKSVTNSNLLIYETVKVMLI